MKVQGDLAGNHLNLLGHQSSDFVRTNPIDVPIFGGGLRHAGISKAP